MSDLRKEITLLGIAYRSLENLVLEFSRMMTRDDYQELLVNVLRYLEYDERPIDSPETEEESLIVKVYESFIEHLTDEENDILYDFLLKRLAEALRWELNLKGLPV